MHPSTNSVASMRASVRAHQIRWRNAQPRRALRIEHLERVRDEPQAGNALLQGDLVGHRRFRRGLVEAQEIFVTFGQRAMHDGGARSMTALIDEVPLGGFRCDIQCVLERDVHGDAGLRVLELHRRGRIA